LRAVSTTGLDQMGAPDGPHNWVPRALRRTGFGSSGIV
jgi:hypothetical protein